MVVEHSTTSGDSSTAAARTAAACTSTGGVTTGTPSMGTETTWSGSSGSNTALVREYIIWLSQDGIDAVGGAGSTAVLGGDTGVFGSSEGATLYRVPETDYSITAGSPVGRWFTPADLAGYDVVASYPGATDSFGNFPVTFDGGTGFAVWVLVLDRISSGGGWSFDGLTKQRFVQDDVFVGNGGAGDVPTVDITDGATAWRLYWKQADGTELRIGPHHNPDGGICYFVTAAGVVYEQGMGVALDSPSVDYEPASFSYHDNPDGVWDDDGAESLDVSGDSLQVRFTRPGVLDVDDANNEAYVDVLYDAPELPVPGAVATSIATWYVRTAPTAGTGVVPHEFRLLDGTVVASDSGALNHLTSSDPDVIADVLANGCVWRMHSESVAALTQVDQAWLKVSWEGETPTVPVTFKSADGSEPVVLPMHQVYP